MVNHPLGAAGISYELRDAGSEETEVRLAPANHVLLLAETVEASFVLSCDIICGLE